MQEKLEKEFSFITDFHPFVLSLNFAAFYCWPQSSCNSALQFPQQFGAFLLVQLKSLIFWICFSTFNSIAYHKKLLPIFTKKMTLQTTELNCNKTAGSFNLKVNKYIFFWICNCLKNKLIWAQLYLIDSKKHFTVNWAHINLFFKQK